MSIEQTSLLYTPQSGQRGVADSGQKDKGIIGGGDFLTMLFALFPATGAEAAAAGAGKNKHGQAAANIPETALPVQTVRASVDYTPQEGMAGDAVLDPALMGLGTVTTVTENTVETEATINAESMIGTGSTIKSENTIETEGTEPSDAMAALLGAVEAALKGARNPDAPGAAISAAAKAVTAETPAQTVRKQKDFVAFLEHLLAGVPESDRMMALGIAPNFQISQDGPGAEAAPALIATGLTPKELTKFMEELAKRLPQVESLLAGMVRLQPPAEKAETLFIPRALIKPPMQVTSPAALAQATAEQSIETKLDALLQARADEAAMVEGEENGFDRILKTLEAAQQKMAASGNGAGPLAQAGAQLSTVAMRTLPLSGLSFPGGMAGQIYPDGMSWEHFAALPGQTMTITGPAAVTSLVGYAPSAAQPHPATQAMAATISKAAIDGETKNITVKLDPPELGRVEIRMEFGKDRNVKAHLVVEKPETYMMLQRDAQVLERSLHDAGMTMDGGGVSFELADDGGMSGDRRGPGNDSGGGSADSGSDAEETNVIEARVDWYVDPQTGMTRYNLTA